MTKTAQISDEDLCARLALALVETGLRNSRLEELHAGISPRTAVGDYSDVKVVTPYGDIPWSRLSRLDDAEMKALMIEVVDRLYTILMHPDALSRLFAAAHWDRPKLSLALMDSVARWQARQDGMSEEEVFATFPIDPSKELPPIRAEQRMAAYEAELDKPNGPGRFEATPDTLRALAEAPLADADWIARAREALLQGAIGWERAELEIQDERDAATYGGD